MWDRIHDSFGEHSKVYMAPSSVEGHWAWPDLTSMLTHIFCDKNSTITLSDTCTSETCWHWISFPTWMSPIQQDQSLMSTFKGEQSWYLYKSSTGSHLLTLMSMSQSPTHAMIPHKEECWIFWHITQTLATHHIGPSHQHCATTS